MISIDTEKCTGCGTCSDVCQNYVFDVKEKSRVRSEKLCAECGQCYFACQSGAITHESYKDAKKEELPPVVVKTEDMVNLINSRRSTRAFLDKNVDDETIEMLLDAAFNAGSSSNGQSEGFIVIKDKKFMKELGLACMDVLWNAGLKFLADENSFMCKLMVKKYGKEMIRQYVRYNHLIRTRRADGNLEEQVFRNAPVAILSHGIKTNVSAYSNSAIALRNMELLAMTKDLGTCWTGFVLAAADKSNKINKMLDLPKDRILTGGIILGYPKHAIKYKIPRPKRDVKVI